tara:strand:+ start:1372 stop:1476 length:105 start_codon:yes stop_codon:yes gene_type:complete
VASWLDAHAPNLLSFEAALGVLGYRLVIRPIIRE